MSTTSSTTDTHVKIFYSSATEQDLLDFYQESIAYLHDTGIDTEIIDINKDTDTAYAFDVKATPTVIIIKDGETRKHIGIIDGLQPVLEDDLYGRSILHKIAFKEGRQTAAENDLTGNTDTEAVETVLEHHILRHGAETFTITAFDPDTPKATVEVYPDPDDEEHSMHDELEPFLGGFFTEVFDAGVMGVETVCARDGNDYCGFTIERQTGGADTDE